MLKKQIYQLILLFQTDNRYEIYSNYSFKLLTCWRTLENKSLCQLCSDIILFRISQDDRYFLSGSLDGKLRLWNIPDKKVTMWNEVGNNGLITTANFCHNGKFAVVGTYDGQCIFYSTEVSVDLVPLAIIP